MLNPVKHQLSYQFYDKGPCGVLTAVRAVLREESYGKVRGEARPPIIRLGKTVHEQLERHPPC